MQLKTPIWIVILVASLLGNLPACGQTSSQTNTKTKSELTQPAPNKQPAVQSVHLQAWQNLLEKFYANEVAIKKTLWPIITRQSESQLFNQHLSQLYTPSLFALWMGDFRRLYIGNPHFPVGPVHIGKIEAESPQQAVIAIGVYGEKPISKEQQWQYLRIGLVYEDKRWVVDQEETIAVKGNAPAATKLQNFTQLTPRNVFGNIYVNKVDDLPLPVLRQNSPEQVLQSLFGLVKYINNERMKWFAQMMPDLVASVQPFVSQRYYEELKKHLQPYPLYRTVEAAKFAPAGQSPFGELPEGQSCWQLQLVSREMPGAADEHTQDYFVIMMQQDKVWKFHMEACRNRDFQPVLSWLIGMHIK